MLAVCWYVYSTVSGRDSAFRLCLSCLPTHGLSSSLHVIYSAVGTNPERCVSAAAVEDVIQRIYVRLVHVDGRLTTLSKSIGFRNYVKDVANRSGVTGTIQRYHHLDILINFEGTDLQINVFRAFLRDCQGKGMVQTFVDYSRVSDTGRLFESFTILTDFSRTVEKGGRVLKGPYSNEEYDKSSVYSADNPI